ncbi:MAG: NADH-quinone oxidoreductase chain 3 [candidate division WS2 bacterium]|uniref:NADH-quinone oxidoreductase chain 3 n=1 Tax=Psychracetigena formicireducens TaxID=2986056 RepID=A0A9E2F487_PSYF1|nr:NADH-quinone oxidoreductase chain 3 [Candidatus Psychracetigena formicireducens]MBT9144746.1 NADH-quinone oxidoreductase chain 3 [Candidatus Psychracetigena formicireducens]MBT9151229.1 NADH-quinone oxidoreductase chain 3 [Candidatus Psychracetigena formicireducens]
MEKLFLKINGNEIEVEPGLTVLQVAKSFGIDIPTLCHHDQLSPIGACRLCVVETKQGTLQPACTLPATQGLEVETESPRVVEARKFILNLLFAERNHYCMFCEASGDCELQNMGYRYGIDHFAFSPYQTKFPTDFSHKYILLEHNRCILCRRCIRACSDLAGHYVLGMVNRGAHTMLSPDMESPLKASSCVSCGACAQVCPTGSLADKIGAFRGKADEMTKTKSVCANCSVGCGILAFTKANHLIKIWGEWESPVNHGILCELGRFSPLNEKRKRVLQPIIRQEGRREVISYQDAIKKATQKLKEAKNPGGIISPKTTNEALEAFNILFSTSLQSKNTGLMESYNEKAVKLSADGCLEDILIANAVVLYKVDPSTSHGVVASWVKKAVTKGAYLYIVTDEENSLSFYATETFKTSEADKLVNTLENSKKVVVILNPQVESADLEILKKVKAVFLPLYKSANSLGAIKKGLNGFFEKSDVALIVASDFSGDGNLLASLQDVSYLIVISNFVSPLTERANLIIPSATWLETSGTFTNLEGKTQDVSSIMEAPEGVKTDKAIIEDFMKALG